MMARLLLLVLLALAGCTLHETPDTFRNTVDGARPLIFHGQDQF